MTIVTYLVSIVKYKVFYHSLSVSKYLSAFSTLKSPGLPIHTTGVSLLAAWI